MCCNPSTLTIQVHQKNVLINICAIFRPTNPLEFPILEYPRVNLSLSLHLLHTNRLFMHTTVLCCDFESATDNVATIKNKRNQWIMHGRWKSSFTSKTLPFSLHHSKPLAHVPF